MPDIYRGNDGDLRLDWDYGPHCILSMGLEWRSAYWAALKGHTSRHGRVGWLGLLPLIITTLRWLHA
jgi:hypothetical protein